MAPDRPVRTRARITLCVGIQPPVAIAASAPHLHRAYQQAGHKAGASMPLSVTTVLRIDVGQAAHLQAPSESRLVARAGIERGAAIDQFGGRPEACALRPVRVRRARGSRHPDPQGAYCRLTSPLTVPESATSAVDSHHQACAVTSCGPSRREAALTPKPQGLGPRGFRPFSPGQPSLLLKASFMPPAMDAPARRCGVYASQPLGGTASHRQIIVLRRR